MGEITTLSQGGEPILTVERRYGDFMAYIMLERHRRSGLLRRKMAACVQQFGCSCSRCSRRNQQGPSTKNRSCRFCSIWGRIYRLRFSAYDYYNTLTIGVLKRKQYLSNICSLLLVLLILLNVELLKSGNFLEKKFGNEYVLKWTLWWKLFLPDWSCCSSWIGLWYSSPLPPPLPIISFPSTFSLLASDISVSVLSCAWALYVSSFL